MTIETLADITPNSTATPLSTNENLRAAWIIFSAVGSTIRVGDANVSASRGILLPTGVPVPFPPPGTYDQGQMYLKQVHVWGVGADKVSVTYGT